MRLNSISCWRCDSQFPLSLIHFAGRGYHGGMSASTLTHTDFALRVFVDRLEAHLAAVAGLAHAAERRSRIGALVAIDPDHPGLEVGRATRCARDKSLVHRPPPSP